MRVLAINCGSSSLKCSLIDTANGAHLLDLRVERIGGDSTLAVDGAGRRAVAAPDQSAAMERILEELAAHAASTGQPEAVVHRIVHGATELTAPTLIDDAVIARIAKLDVLAPLHNPPALAALRIARARLPLPQVAMFDTAFHATLPPRAREYALPRAVSAQFGIRRYGFHGINHAHVMQEVAKFLRRPPQELRIVSCHLGNGASVAAIEYGRSVETSMGMTPLEGLVMGTRPGDVDPGVLLHLLREGYDAARLDALMNRESGLKGLAGSNDLREIEERAAGGDESCRRALTIYAHRVRKYIGAYAAAMGGVDAIAFTGGIGENSALIRNRTLQRLDFLGARLDDDRNRDARADLAHPAVSISEDRGRVALLVIRADEEAAMAQAAAALLVAPRPTSNRRVPIGVSARHVHLTRSTIERLFGEGYELEPGKQLSQHGQFAARETVTLIGPRGRIDKVRIMGPVRSRDQVEISRSDEFVLGIDAPVRISGDLANTPGITLAGPRGEVKLESGVVCARRHIHMNPDDAARLGIADHDSVSVRVDSDGRDLTFNDVTVRVAPEFELELHLDTDEANAAGVEPGMTAEIL